MSSVVFPYHIIQNVHEKMYEVEKIYDKLYYDILESNQELYTTSRLLTNNKNKISELEKNIEKMNNELEIINFQIEEYKKILKIILDKIQFYEK